MPQVIVVMGVSGSGKTTTGAALARRLGVPFADADDFHPPANIAKMAAGVPLDDDDRVPWLRAIGQWIAEHRDGGVVTCSALKRSFRDGLRAAAPSARFLHLAGDPEVVRARVAARSGHFMPVSLVASQYAALEPLEPDEPGLVLDLSLPVDALVDAYLNAEEGNPS
ncbi:gluconokinase [Saccharothrix australiensis]|uniref:Gluconokinase n=1 Tax=Saccharothrix australiensis TaxID=2072 RepID=A0A495W8S1_9PSEU|nr:gluconokinase [Saccharothrix australiensis]RKT56178.1 gluconate kinase (SKI family) [Saccharothrix australiensis]